MEVSFALGHGHMIEVLDPEIWEERESQVKRALSKITKAIKHAYRTQFVLLCLEYSSRVEIKIENSNSDQGHIIIRTFNARFGI